jgi:signal transduction histidine kinase
MSARYGFVHNGMGIADSELKSIFSEFYRGLGSRDGELGNSGLGLGCRSLTTALLL